MNGVRIGFLAAVAVCFSAVSAAQPVDLKGLQDYPEQPVTEATWQRNQQNMRWMSRNFSVKPSLVLARGDRIYELEQHPDYDPGLEQRTFSVPGADAPLTLADALVAANTDAYLVLKDGKLLFERYFHGFDAHTHHSWYSGAKSLIGMAVGILVEQGRLDVTKTPADYIPALKGSAYDQVTVRQALNMTSALAYTEDPEAMQPGHLRHEYVKRAGMLPPYDVYTQTQEPGENNVPRGVRALATLVGLSEQVKPGERFDYQNINVDVAGWLIEAVSGQPLDKFLRDAVWRKLQTEHDALIPTDPNFTALAAGGISSTARDMARFGLAIVNGGVLGGERIFPNNWIEDTCRYNPDDENAFARRQRSPGDFSSLGSIGAYRNYWYIFDSGQCAMASRGYGGQSVYINRASGIVVAVFSSATAADSVNKNRMMHITHQLAGRISRKPF